MTGLKAKHNQAAAIVAELSLEDKARLCSGRNFWHLEAIESHDIPRVMVTDGPHGLRKQEQSADHVGLNASVPATCFPTACALASTWDPNLLEQVGAAMGRECVAENVTVLLGPGMNIKRHPYCGRNFEYLSEDPWLNGKLGAALVRGVQSQGVGASVKHYAVNNQEQGRMVVDVLVDERTLREIYLRGFEIAVREAQPWTVMCAYNRVNGTYCGEHEQLLNRILRDEWGFEGLVMTDWGATNDRVAGVRTGLDLEMPGSGGINDEKVLAAAQAGTLQAHELDRVVTRNVSLSLLGADVHKQQVTADHAAHHALARRAAAASCVLLKNTDAQLPLQSTQAIAVIGAFAKRPRYQGAGSSQVRPTQLDNLWDALEASIPDLRYAPGYEPKHSAPDAALIEEAVAAARAAEVAVVVAGLPGIYESEGFDRTHMDLPAQHNALIEAVCAANPNTVVVLCNGAPVSMPWVDAPRAIVEAYLGGQAGGSGLADVLLGHFNPGGKLAETFPLAASDVPANAWFPGAPRQVQYREGLYVGYRYFDSAAAPVLFPFGHGLSYTTFEFARPQATSMTYAQGGQLHVRLTVTNTGPVSGSETVQLYLHRTGGAVYRPEQELKAFHRVYLDAGESRQVEFVLDDNAFNIYDPTQGAWLVEPGQYQIRLGASSRDIRHGFNVQVESPHQVTPEPSPQTHPRVRASTGLGADHSLDVPDVTFAAMLGRTIPEAEATRPFHLNSTVGELSASRLGQQLQKRILADYMRNMGVDSSDETLHKMFEEMARHMPLRSLALFSRGKTRFADIEALVALLNHEYVRALRLKFGRSG